MAAMLKIAQRLSPEFLSAVSSFAGRFAGTSRGRLIGGLVVLAGAVVLAWTRLSGSGSGNYAVAPPTPSGYEAEDHFPGAAWFTAVDAVGTPGPGSTGTAALPDLPNLPGGTSGVADGTIPAASPFLLQGTQTDRARALLCLTDAIYYEAATEPDAGQRAVAQVVLNRVRHPAFPATVCGVVFQGSEKRGCQFSFACDGSMARRPPIAWAWTRAQRVAEAALNGSVFTPVGWATHYHTYAVTPSWNRSMVMTGVFGAHFFHRWQGWWGTPAAYTQRYLGHEPTPGPHGSTMQQTAQMTEALRDSSPLPPQPATDDPAATTAATPSTPTSIADAQVLDKWKDSGKPLR